MFRAYSKSTVTPHEKFGNLENDSYICFQVCESKTKTKSLVELEKFQKFESNKRITEELKELK